MILKDKASAAIISTTLLLLLTAGVAGAQGRAANSPKPENSGSTKQDKRVVTGSVEEISPTSVTVEDKKGGKKEVMLDAQTKVIGSDKKPARVNALKPNDKVTLISTTSGTATGSAGVRAKKIFIQNATQSAMLKRRAVQGVISAINGSTITLTHQVKSSTTTLVTVTGATRITMKDATGSATLASLAVGQRVIAAGDVASAGGILAKKIHVIPGKATGLMNKRPAPSASASAKPSASASATPVATSAATPRPSASASASPVATGSATGL